MAGAAMLVNENGIFGTQINKPGPTRQGVLSANSRFCRSARKVFEEFARFRDLHRRPAGQPRAAIGIVQGHLDGWNNIPQEGQGVWGQHGGDHWQWGAAEAAWKYLDVFLPGGRWLSGTPHGQVDVVSSDAPTAVLREYRLLVLLGWHTMTRSFLAK